MTVMSVSLLIFKHILLSEVNICFTENCETDSIHLKASVIVSSALNSSCGDKPLNEEEQDELAALLSLSHSEEEDIDADIEDD